MSKKASAFQVRFMAWKRRMVGYRLFPLPMVKTDNPRVFQKDGEVFKMHVPNG